MSWRGGGLWLALLGSSCLGGLSFERGAGAFCDLDSPCIAGLYCLLEDNECQPEIALAQVCDRDLACASKACVDGVCCEQACEGACSICNLPGSVGHCAPAPAGTDPLDACAGTTSCGPEGVCQASPLWSAFYGGVDVQTTRDVATGAVGDVVVAGSFLGFLDFGQGTPAHNPGLEDAFVAKYGPDGQVAWTLVAGGDGRQVIEAVRVDGASNVFVAGWFEQTMLLDGVRATATDADPDGFVAMLDSGGNLMWLRQLAGAGEQRALALALDEDAHRVFLGALVGGTIDLDSCSQTATSAEGEVAVAALSELGACIDMQLLAGSGVKRAVGLAVGADDGLIVVVTGRGQQRFGGIQLDGASDDDDVFVGKLGPTLGDAIWAKRLGGDGDDAVAGVAVASNNDIWLAGSFAGMLDVGAGAPLVADAGRDAFVLRLNAFGAHASSDRYGGAYDQELLAVAVSARDEVVVGGRFELSLAAGNGTLVAEGGFDVFLSKLSPDGTPAWSLPLGGPMNETLAGVVFDFASNIAVAGDYEASLAIEPDDVHTAAGASDGFVAKLTP